MLVGGGELRRLEQTADRSMKQSDVRAVCQGVPGAYSHRAALRFFEAPELVFRSTWKEVFETVKSGEADFGVLPVENSAAGSVSAVYDLILRYRFYIVGAVGIKVEHLSLIHIYSQRFLLGFFGGFMHGMAFLPQEFRRTKKGPGGFFPTYYRTPLVVNFRQIAVRTDYLLIVLTE